jgi:hypothetical protein
MLSDLAKARILATAKVLVPLLIGGVIGFFVGAYKSRPTTLQECLESAAQDSRSDAAMYMRARLCRERF